MSVEDAHTARAKVAIVALRTAIPFDSVIFWVGPLVLCPLITRFARFFNYSKLSSFFASTLHFLKKSVRPIVGHCRFTLTFLDARPLLSPSASNTATQARRTLRTVHSSCGTSICVENLNDFVIRQFHCGVVCGVRCIKLHRL